MASRNNPSNNIGSEIDKTLSSQTNKSTFSLEQLKAFNARFDSLEAKLEAYFHMIIDEITNGSHAKDILLTSLFSSVCELKAMGQSHPTARQYGMTFRKFIEYINENHPAIKNLNELKPIMMSGFMKWLKKIHKKTGDRTEKLADNTINGHIKRLRHALETVDKIGTQELREPLQTIKRPRRKKKPYIPTEEELSKIPETLITLRKSKNEEARYLAFVGATVVQLCGRTNALSELRFDMIEENGDNKPIVSYIGKHRVEQVKGITNEWYRDFLWEWKEYVQKKYGDAQYFFPRQRNGEINHLTDERLRMKFKEFMQLCGLPQLTIHSFRYIYATKLYLKGVPREEIKDILGVDKRTLDYYIKATEERKKKVLFTHLEKVSALPK